MQMRYQWWREAIGSTFKGSPPTHPLTLALAEVLKTSTHLKKYNFTRLIDAREADVLDTQPPLDVKVSNAKDYAVDGFKFKQVIVVGF